MRTRELLQSGADGGVVAWCWPVRYELMIDAQGPDEIAAVDRALEGLREIVVDRSVQRGVLAAMRTLAETGSHGAHRLPLADLTVALAAQTAGLAILHYDHHFERLGALLGVRTLWVAEPER
jgi:predicted nucleic acid-binding protein